MISFYIFIGPQIHKRFKGEHEICKKSIFLKFGKKQRKQKKTRFGRNFFCKYEVPLFVTSKELDQL